MDATLAARPKERVLRAGFWSFALLIAEKLAAFARVVVLALLLTPRQFGLFGFAVLAMMAIQAMTRTGFQQALIREPRDISRHLDVAWSVQLVRGVLLGLLLLFCAPALAGWFDEPGAAGLTRAIAAVPLLQALANIGVVHFQKQLDLRREFIYRLSGTLADLLVSVAAAWMLRSAWALVAGMAAGELVRAVVSYAIHPFRPRLSFAREPLMDLVRYGIWLSLAGIMLFAGTRAPGLVVGKLAGAAALGLYQMAYRIPQMAIREVAAAVERFALPAYALVQHDPARLLRSYLGIAGMSLALVAPAAVGIAVLGGPFVAFFMRAEWAPMIPALTLLAVSGLIRIIPATGYPLFQACNAPRVNFFIQGARAAALVACIYPLTLNHGIAGAAVAMICAALAGGGVWLIAIRRVLHWKLGDLREGFLPPLLSALAMGALLLPLRLLTLAWAEGGIAVRIAWMAGMILAGGMVYAAVFWTLVRRAPHSVLTEAAGEILRAGAAWRRTR